MSAMPEVLGVDIWKVLIREVPGRSFRDEPYLDYPEVEDAFRVLRRLHDERFGSNIHLVTRCGRKVRGRRLSWLDHHDFWKRTGIPRVPPRYCWSPRNKSDACYDMGMTHFIDDDPRELVYLEGYIPNLICLQEEAQQMAETSLFNALSMTRVDSWSEIERLLLPS
jgi:hypothetical protein